MKQAIQSAATTCHVTHMGDQGSGTQFFVRAPDGYLMDCGGDQDRAVAVAKAINASLDGNAWPPISGGMPF